MSSNSQKRSHDNMDDEKKMKVTKIADSVKKPLVGLRLEMLDADYIWSPARVIKVDKDKKGVTHVTVRYDGWGDSYDERVPWTTERLAPRFAYTKQVKCFANIVSKPKGNPPRAVVDALPPGAKKAYSALWPCKVQIRMPHPVMEGTDDENKCLYAEEFLRAEENVFIQPYGSHLLPKVVRECNIHDHGRWIKAKRLRPWTNEPLKLGVLAKNCFAAFEISQTDAETVGALPVSAFEKGSLLKAIYRVHSRAGAQVRDGALAQVSDVPDRLVEEQPKPVFKPPDVVQIRQPEAQQEMPTTQQSRPRAPAPPPYLPPAIQITESVYHDCGVKRCKMTNQWTASICVGGNEIFLGTFPTQTQAYQATRKAAGENDEIETNLRSARLADLRAVPIEAVVEATEKEYKESIHEFSLHEYALAQMRYEQDRIEREVQQGGNRSDVESSGGALPPLPRKKKRKGAPRKVDLEKHCYLEEHRS